MAFGNRLGREQKLAFHCGNPSGNQRAILAKSARKSAPPLRILFRLLALLPLGANHALGALAGRLTYALSPRWRRRTRENLAASGVCRPEEVGRMARENAAEIGKG